MITVDATPYAMKNEETTVVLYDQNSEYVTNEILLAENSSFKPLSSEFELGTKEFPKGLPVSVGGTALNIEWNSSVTWTDNPKTVIVYDSDGNRYVYNVTESRTDYAIVIPYSAIQNGGVNLSKVWRITVGGIGNCIKAVSWITSVVKNFVNARKAVIPLFKLNANQAVNIVVNDEVYSIPTGESQNENIVFVGGNNSVAIPLSGTGTAITRMTATFREGKL